MTRQITSRPAVAVALLLAVGLCGVAHQGVVASGGGRRLRASCDYDDCGLWCGPPRPPPCGSGMPSLPPPCTGKGGTTTPSGSWGLDFYSNSCLCLGGSWVQCQPANPPQNKGCIGGLPFGLENCVCDGASVGEVAGLAACGRVVTECLPPVAAFSLTDDGMLESIQQVCDTMAMDACISSAQTAPVTNNACGDLLRLGTGLCPSAKAMQIFMGSVNLSCEPLCKDC